MPAYSPIPNFQQSLVMIKRLMHSNDQQNYTNKNSNFLDNFNVISYKKVLLPVSRHSNLCFRMPQFSSDSVFDDFFRRNFVPVFVHSLGLRTVKNGPYQNKIIIIHEIEKNSPSIPKLLAQERKLHAVVFFNQS